MNEVDAKPEAQCPRSFERVTLPSVLEALDDVPAGRRRALADPFVMTLSFSSRRWLDWATWSIIQHPHSQSESWFSPVDSIEHRQDHWFNYSTGIACYSAMIVLNVSTIYIVIKIVKCRTCLQTPPDEDYMHVILQACSPNPLVKTATEPARTG